MKMLGYVLVALGLAACASSRSLDKKELAQAIREKVESRDYIVDISYEFTSTIEAGSMDDMGYIHVKGDTLISRMWYDFGYFNVIVPPKNYWERIPERKYEIKNYRVEKWKNQTRVTFEFYIPPTGPWEGGMSKYLLIFGRRLPVRVYTDDYPLNGGKLRL